MFCSKCGQQILDEAVICPHCGCATGNYPNNTTNQTNNGHSADYPQLKSFMEQVKTPYVLSIVSLVLCLGIGFIFAIISMIQCKNIQVPSLNLTTPADIAEFESAERKLSTAKRLSAVSLGIALIVLGLAFLIGMIIGVTSTF